MRYLPVNVSLRVSWSFGQILRRLRQEGLVDSLSSLARDAATLFAPFLRQSIQVHRYKAPSSTRLQFSINSHTYDLLTDAASSRSANEQPFATINDVLQECLACYIFMHAEILRMSLPEMATLHLQFDSHSLQEVIQKSETSVGATAPSLASPSVVEASVASGKAALVGDLRGVLSEMESADRTSEGDAGHQSDDVKEIDSESRRTLRDTITRGLTRTERLIITLYYYEQMTMRDIGHVLNLSESRISQMHSSILSRLKASMQTRATEKSTET
jgi:RNA polymerase sigma factor (sigma-70 family)